MLKIIAEKLSLTFRIGDNKMLLDLMFDNDGFVNFYGKKKGRPQFLQSVKEFYPDIDEGKLYEDYQINRALVFSNRNYIRNYQQLSYLYPNYEFIFEAPNEDDINEEADKFKILDKLVIPIDSSFWNIYLPPNHFGDGCSVRVSKKEITPIPRELPDVDKRFHIDRNEIFYTKDQFKKKSKISSSSELNFDRLILEAFEDVYGQKGVDFVKSRLKSADNE